MTVYLVGAGPGDPGLITVRGAELLARADVVIYDRLSAPSLLDLVPATAQRIYVGKRGSEGSVPQERINELLVEHGATTSVVVRLKGGDPFVFARGAEELEVLRAAGIAAEVVPGITSAIAAPAYAGIPVTRRYSSTSVTIVTGHEDPTKERSEVDWEAIARVGGTIVVLMGVANIGRISERLIAGGLRPGTPAAAVRWGTRPNQHTTRATLATIAAQPLAAPSVIVIGEVAADELEWFASRPLAGRRVVVTRAPAQASRLTDRLLSAGADVINLPTIAIADPPDGGVALAAAAASVRSYDWVVLTSPNGAERFLDSVGDARHLAGVRLAVIGPGTAAVLRARLLEPDLVPGRYVAEGLLEDFPAGPGRVLIPQAVGARSVLVEGLVERGFTVDVVPAYETVPADVPEGALAEVATAGAVVFASSSAVTNFVAAVPPASRPAVAIAIGPISAATARDAGFAVVLEAAQHDLDGLVAAVLEWASPS